MLFSKSRPIQYFGNTLLQYFGKALLEYFLIHFSIIYYIEQYMTAMGKSQIESRK